jgi:hypothetical protein
MADLKDEGDGYGSGYDEGYGEGSGNGWGSGDGYGSGSGEGWGYGWGDGEGSGEGWGSGKERQRIELNILSHIPDSDLPLYLGAWEFAETKTKFETLLKGK